MNNINSIISLTVLIILVAASLATFFWEAPVETIILFSVEHPFGAAFIFVLLMFLGTVVAPFTTIPAVPAATAILNPLLVAILSIIGWTFGAIVAFMIARRFGKPLLGKFVNLKKIESYESRIPKSTEFLTLILMRMIIPVDVLSYAVGFVSNMKLRTYTIATIIGITPFAFVFSFGGSAFFSGQYSVLLFIVGFGVALFALVWHVLILHKNDYDKLKNKNF
jgi:uncharacterized membrane protein YdjX (TVP38/TMEM64 family)